MNFYGDSVYYESKVQKDPREFLLFSFKKDMIFIWDKVKQEYVVNAKRSQITLDDVDGLFADGSDEFYARYKKSIEELKSSGNSRQKEWAEVFETVQQGKGEVVWDEAKKSYYVEAKK